MKKFLAIFSALAIALSVFTPATLPASEAQATLGHAKYKYLVGTGVLCGLDPSACPVISRADNGDTIELTGEGSLSLFPMSVDGGGTFVHKAPDGSVIGEGTWEAKRIISFTSYGSGSAQGLPEDFWGGRAVILARIMPEAGGSFTAILEIICTLGDHIPPEAHEGIELSVFGGPRFTEEVSGFTLFIREEGHPGLHISSARLSGTEEVPPTESGGTGLAMLWLSPDGTRLNYTLFVGRLEDITAAHIHYATAGVNGPVVATLFSGPTTDIPIGRVLARGSITEDDLQGPLAGHSLTELLHRIEEGRTYINVHTETNPGGDIRGRIH